MRVMATYFPFWNIKIWRLGDKVYIETKFNDGHTEQDTEHFNSLDEILSFMRGLERGYSLATGQTVKYSIENI